jgi:hypothetical protein
MICTLQNLIFFFCCVRVSHARFGRKPSDLNDAELPLALGAGKDSFPEVIEIILFETSLL